MPATFAHEFEHQLFKENSFMSRICPEILRDRRLAGNKIQKNILQSIDLSKTNFEDALSSVSYLTRGKKNLNSFLQNFDRMDTPNRIRAFFTGMTRNVIHPKNEGSLKDITKARQIIQDEARAYGITDRVLQYQTGMSKNSITPAGVYSEFLNYADDILRQEQKLALFTKTSSKTVHRGCPSGTHELNILEQCLKRRQSKIA